MERKDITIGDAHQNWLEKHPDYNLSQQVRNMLDNEMESEQWATTPVTHTPGITLGEHTLTQNEITYNRFDSPFDSNWLITGGVGNGKTTGSLIHLNQYITNPDITTPVIITLDTLGTTTQFTTHHDGIQHTITDNTGINPLHVTPYTNTTDKPVDKLSQLKPFFNTVFGALTDVSQTTNSLTPDTWSVLSYAIETIYNEQEIDITNPATYDSPSPTIRDDLIPLLTKIGNKVHETTTPHPIDKDAQIAADILTKLTSLQINNAIPGRFTGHTELTPPTTSPPPVIQFDFTNTSHDDNASLLYSALIDVYGYAAALEENVIIYIDESRHFLQHPSIMNGLTELFRNTRHHHISMQLATQTIEEFTTANNFQELWGLSSHKLMYQDESINAISNAAINMNNEQKQHVKHAKSGSAQTGYSEAVLKLPNIDWQPVRITLDSDTKENLLM
jgi:hypothetical protein